VLLLSFFQRFGQKALCVLFFSLILASILYVLKQHQEAYPFFLFVVTITELAAWQVLVFPVFTMKSCGLVGEQLQPFLDCKDVKTARPSLSSAVGAGKAGDSNETLFGGMQDANDEYTALHQAAKNGHADTVRVLVELGADVNVRDNDGWTALQRAAVQGHVDTVRVLVELGADVNITNGWAALHLAAAEQDADTMRVLVELGADVNIWDHNWSTALHEAAEKGHADTVRVLVELGANVNIQNKDKWTALHTAAWKGNADTVRVLVELGADVNIRDEIRGRTALHEAAFYGHADTVRVLVELDADVNIQGIGGRTALLEAAWIGDADAVTVLVELGGADVNIWDEEGMTPLHEATFQDRADTIRALVELGGSNVNIRSKYGQTAIHTAARHGDVGMLRALVEIDGADINIRDKYGKTALHLAAKIGYVSVCEILVEHHADLTLEDHKKETALAKAKKSAHSDVAAFLADKLGKKEEAKYLAEGRFHTVFVCEREIFLQLPRLIKCEVAIEKGIVRELRPDELINKRIAFASHRWLRGFKTLDPSVEQQQAMERSRDVIRQLGYTEEQAPMEPHPDDYQNQKIKGFQHALQLSELIGVELVWMDYLCIPQVDLSAQLLAINTLSYTVRICSDFVVLLNENTGVKNFNHLDEGSWEVYNSRGWCRLECLSASAPKQSSEQIQKWKCSYSNDVVEIEPLTFPSVSVFNPYEGEFAAFQDKNRIALMVYKLGQCLADTYSCTDLAGMMRTAHRNISNNQIRQRYEEDLKHFFNVQSQREG